MSEANGILALNPDGFREIDGVVFDLDSYARHCKPPEPEVPAEEVVSSTAPAPVFAADPVHVGWYAAEEGQPAVPIMGGALSPEEATLCEEGGVTVTRTVFLPAGSGSGSGSYLTSYTTSYRTSWHSSGSGSYRFGSDMYPVGGYGLELI